MSDARHAASTIFSTLACFELEGAQANDVFHERMAALLALQALRGSQSALGLADDNSFACPLACPLAWPCDRPELGKWPFAAPNLCASSCKPFLVAPFTN